MKNSTQIAAAIRKLMENDNLTESGLAEVLEVNQSTISRWLTGESATIRQYNFGKLAPRIREYIKSKNQLSVCLDGLQFSAAFTHAMAWISRSMGDLQTLHAECYSPNSEDGPSISVNECKEMIAGYTQLISSMANELNFLNDLLKSFERNDGPNP